LLSHSDTQFPQILIRIFRQLLSRSFCHSLYFLQRPLARLLSLLLPRQFLPLSMGPDPKTEEAPT
jgi:hypothetical protein